MSAVTTNARRHFAFIMLFASVVRAAMLFFAMDSLTADPDAYRRIARGLSATGVFGLLVNELPGGFSGASGETEATLLERPEARATAFRPPLYPWMLSFIVAGDGQLTNVAVAGLHWLLGVTTVAGVFYLAKLVRLPSSVASLAAILVAIDPVLLRSSALVMTETLATSLSVLGLIAWVRLIRTVPESESGLPIASRVQVLVAIRALVLGICVSLAFLCRPTFIVWPIGLGGLLVLLAMRSRGWSVRLLHLSR